MKSLGFPEEHGSWTTEEWKMKKTKWSLGLATSEKKAFPTPHQRGRQNLSSPFRCAIGGGGNLKSLPHDGRGYRISTLWWAWVVKGVNQICRMRASLGVGVRGSQALPLPNLQQGGRGGHVTLPVPHPFAGSGIGEPCLQLCMVGGIRFHPPPTWA